MPLLQLTTEMEVRNGDAREVLCNAAKEYNPDMLVIGGNGHGVLKRYCCMKFHLFGVLRISAFAK